VIFPRGGGISIRDVENSVTNLMIELLIAKPEIPSQLRYSYHKKHHGINAHISHLYPHI